MAKRLEYLCVASDDIACDDGVHCDVGPEEWLVDVDTVTGIAFTRPIFSGKELEEMLTEGLVP